MSIPKPDDLQTLLKKAERHLHITPTPSNSSSSSTTNKNNKCLKYDHQKQTQVEEPAAAAVLRHNRNKDLEGGVAVGISSLETVTADEEDYLQTALDLLFEQSERTLCICNNENDRSQSSSITLPQKYDTTSSNSNRNRNSNRNNSNGGVLDDIIDRKHTQMVLKQDGCSLQNRPQRTKQTSTHHSIDSINTAADVIHSNSQLGLINLKLQNFKKAVICFERALEAANQKWPFGHYNVMILRECIADSYLLQKNYVKARQEYTLMKSVFEIIGTHTRSDNNNCRQLSVRVLQKFEYSNTKLKEQSDGRKTQAFLY